MTRDPHEPPLGDELPEALRRKLREWDARPVSVRPERDAAIRADIDGHFARMSRWRRWRWPAGIAAAAAVVLAVVLVQQEVRPPQTRSRAAVVRNDLDGNGRVDVLDAFLVARRLESDAPPPPRFDVNRDGVVDRRDVDRLAALAVRLSDD